MLRPRLDTNMFRRTRSNVRSRLLQEDQDRAQKTTHLHAGPGAV